MTTTTIDNTGSFRALDCKIFDGLMKLMLELKSQGFDDEFSNAVVMRGLMRAADKFNGSSVTVRTYFCYTTQAHPAIRVEIRNAMYKEDSAPEVVVLSGMNSNSLVIV